jgi:hypothetical protein
MTGIVLVASTSAACGSLPPIMPAKLPAEPTTYSDPGTSRSFSAPAGGKLMVEKFGNGVVYGDDAAGVALVVRGLPSPLAGGVSESDLDSIMRDKAQKESTSSVVSMMKEVAGDATVRCFEIVPTSQNGHPRKGAACFSDNPNELAMILAIFVGGADAYTSMGGVRVAADAAKSAKGFTPH